VRLAVLEVDLEARVLVRTSSGSIKVKAMVGVHIGSVLRHQGKTGLVILGKSKRPLERGMPLNHTCVLASRQQHACEQSHSSRSPFSVVTSSEKPACMQTKRIPQRNSLRSKTRAPCQLLIIAVEGQMVGGPSEPQHWIKVEMSVTILNLIHVQLAHLSVDIRVRQG
jgi:hypothetical protein